jgi:hypothetical protein
MERVTRIELALSVGEARVVDKAVFAVLAVDRAAPGCDGARASRPRAGAGAHVVVTA